MININFPLKFSLDINLEICQSFFAEVDEKFGISSGLSENLGKMRSDSRQREGITLQNWTHLSRSRTFPQFLNEIIITKK